MPFFPRKPSRPPGPERQTQEVFWLPETGLSRISAAVRRKPPGILGNPLHGRLSDLAASYRPLTNPFQQLGKADPGDLCRPRQQAGCGHSRQRIRFEAPETTVLVAPEVDAAIGPELQHLVRSKGIVLQKRRLQIGRASCRER